MGGVDETETMYGGKKHRRTGAKVRSSKVGGKKALKNYGGILAGSHNFGTNSGISKKQNTGRYGWSQK
jgi:hypothetical protein